MSDPKRPATQSEFEFSAAHNQTFAELADIIRFVAILILLFGGLGVAAGALTLGTGEREPFIALVWLAEGVVGILIGTWLRLAAGSFDDITDTGGGDIAHLMQALSRLARVFRLQAWLLGFGLLLLLGMIAMSAVRALTG